MKILVTAELTKEVLAELANSGSITVLDKCYNSFNEKEKEIARILEKSDIEVLILDETPLRNETIKKARSLKIILSNRGNPANVDSNYCRNAGILLGRSPGRNANAVAEFTLALILNVVRRIPEAVERLKNSEFTLDGSWQEKRNTKGKDTVWISPELARIPYYEFRSPELAIKMLGIVGFGAIGKMVAKKCHALDMKIQVYDPYIEGKVPNYVEMVSLEKLTSTSDIISIHAKETKENEGMIGNDFFTNIKRGTFLVNTSRGRLIDRFSLIDALRKGTLAGAALDVFDYEPLCTNDPLLSTPRLICTPHISGASSNVIFHHSQSIIENFRAYIAKKL